VKAKDLVVLVADLDIETIVSTILRERRRSLGIREIAFDVLRFTQHDAGCYLNGPEFLRDKQRLFANAMIVFDRFGCGREELTRDDVEIDVESRMEKSGWGNRCAAVCIDPEVESWLWGRTKGLETALGWGPDRAKIEGWLNERGLWPKELPKPPRPKAAMKKVLREVHLRSSPAILEKIAKKVSLLHCKSQSFAKLSKTLKAWFPAAP
jgi:hypothetical protein